MTENGEPIHELGIQDAEGNFTALAALDYDTVNDELSLKHLQENVELRTDGTSWNPNVQIGDETQPVPGTSHFEAVNTGEATVAGQRFDLGYEHIRTDDLSGDGSSDVIASFTLPEFEDYMISVSGAFGTEDIILELGGVDDGDYYQVDRDGASLVRTSDANQLSLVQSTGDTTRWLGHYSRARSARPVIFGNGLGHRFTAGRTMVEASAVGAFSSLDITITVPNSDFDRLDIEWFGRGLR